MCMYVWYMYLYIHTHVRIYKILSTFSIRITGIFLSPTSITHCYPSLLLFASKECIRHMYSVFTQFWLYYSKLWSPKDLTYFFLISCINLPYPRITDRVFCLFLFFKIFCVPFINWNIILLPVFYMGKSIWRVSKFNSLGEFPPAVF